MIGRWMCVDGAMESQKEKKGGKAISSRKTSVAVGAKQERKGTLIIENKGKDKQKTKKQCSTYKDNNNV